MATFNRRPQIDDLLMENSINDGVNVGNGISYASGITRALPCTRSKHPDYRLSTNDNSFTARRFRRKRFIVLERLRRSRFAINANHRSPIISTWTRYTRCTFDYSPCFHFPRSLLSFFFQLPELISFSDHEPASMDPGKHRRAP